MVSACGREARIEGRAAAGVASQALRLGLTTGTICGMTKKIGVSLRQELYDWAAREVEEGRAESVSALIAQGLELLETRAQLEAVVTELHSEVGELDDQAKARLAEALAAADEAYRRRRGSSAGHAA